MFQVATNGSILYFLISEMAQIDHMYEVKLQQCYVAHDQSDPTNGRYR